jgi:hypothetical protein
MKVTSEEAYQIYARACRAWYGKNAIELAQKQIAKFRARGDHGGVDAWTKVAHNLKQLGDEEQRSSVSSGAT